MLQFIVLAISLCLSSGFHLKPSFKTKNLKLNMIDSNFQPHKIITELSGQINGETWTYSKLIEQIKEHHIDGITFINDGNIAVSIDNVLSDGSYHTDNLHYTKLLPQTYDTLIHLLTQNSIAFDVFGESLKNNGLMSMLSQSFFTIGIYSLIVFSVNRLIRSNPELMEKMARDRMNSQNISQISDYGNIFRNLGNKKPDPPIETRFKDVAGCDEAKFELTETVDFLKNPEKYKEAGAKIPKGILLEGPPGTGKTLLAKAVAGEAEVPFLSASGSEFIEMYVGVGASRVRSLFDKAAELAPCVVFIDEIDAVGRKRGAGIAGGNDEREQTLNEILTRMDGFDTIEGIIVMGATNRIDILDSALVRPGRFDRKVTVSLPDYDGRKAIAGVHFNNKKLHDNFDYNEVAALTNGFSGADLANLANEAAILSVRQNKTSIDKDILFDAYEKVTLGLKSYNQDPNEKVTELITYHETGHGILVKIFNEFFELRKITINSNKSGAGGYTLFTPKEFFSKYPSKKFCLAQLVICLGGRAAEVYLSRKNYDPENVTNQIFEDYTDLDVTTGATNDLEQAFNLAKLYITRFGFSENFKIDIKDKSLPFLGEQLNKNNNNDGCQGLNSEINYLIQYSFEKAYDLINKNEDIFLDIIKILKEKRTIGDNDINNLFDNNNNNNNVV
jgi:cell division protease FtsH